MWQSLNNLFENKPKMLWDESDIRHAIQNWLREQTHSQQIICQQVEKDKIVVRVGSALLQQEVHLLEYELKEYMAKECQYVITTVKITQR